VLLANHESHLDPVLVGVASRRPLSFLARKSLFQGPFGLLIRSLDAIPLDRDGMGIAGLREVIRRLKQGEATLVFPEGTRTHDGEIGPFQPGFGILVRRSGATIVPVGVDGAYEAWPRHRRLPRPVRIAVLSDEDLTALVRRRIVASVRVAQACLGRERGDKMRKTGE
jgi:1-acyl-sn-glycerol-3-phosphate acyltransferase